MMGNEEDELVRFRLHVIDGRWHMSVIKVSVEKIHEPYEQ